MASGEPRQRILEAMIVVVGRQGYRATTVGDAIAEAGTSRTTFYKHFDDKHDCFFTAYELVAKRMTAAVEAGCDERRPWLERVRGGLGSLVDLLAGDPELARTAIVEVAVAGGEARRRQLAVLGDLARLLEAGRERDRELPAETALMAVGAVAGLLFDEIRAGRAAALTDHLPELLFALLVPYLGPRAAAEEMRQPLAYPAASR